MEIVFIIEKSKLKPAEEAAFGKPLIRIGRDPSASDIVFDNSEYRMVSRHHAEICFDAGKWLIRDLGSSFGTLLNGNRISEPAVLKSGSTIQFGENGPSVKVVKINESVLKEEIKKPKSVPQQADPRPSENTGYESADAGDRVTKESTIIWPMLAETGNGRVFPIEKNTVWLGRDPNCEIVIESSEVMVSRRHAEITMTESTCVIKDNQTFNGTLINEQRILVPTELRHEDQVRLGHGGPVLKYVSPFASVAVKNPIGTGVSGGSSGPATGAGTMVFNLSGTSNERGYSDGSKQLLIQVAFNGKPEITIGRNAENDIILDGLQISGRHARLKKRASGVIAEDLNSTNGVYVNGERISSRSITKGDSVQIGSFTIEFDDLGGFCVFDTRSKTRVDAVGITKDVKNRSGGGTLRLLDDISLSIQPNEFVGLLGPSGAGKSTLIDAINGVRPPTAGNVFINGQDLYRFIDSLKQSIGYVPQDEIIHRALTVEKALYYIAKLRLSRDISRSEINRIINEVLDVTGLTERRGVAIEQLSGGQRKRVSIAVELITKPSVIYLDEPTSGLDPSTELKIMLLFRQIAESGRTVILTTHAMENVRLFDKIVVLMRGKLVFYGKPREALDFFGAESFSDLYDKLEEPVTKEVTELGETSRFEVTDRVSGIWRGKFQKSVEYGQNVSKPLKEITQTQHTKAKTSHRLGIFGAIRQWVTLTSRYTRVLLKDRFNLFILFSQAPLIAILVYLVMGANQTRDFAYFALSLCAIWFGTSIAAREIVRERKIFERERMVNLGIIPYLASKYAVLGLIVAFQCLFLFIPLKLLDLTGLMPMPGMFAGIPQLITMLITAGVGVSLGLFVSALVKTSETATSLIPLILIPQIIFSGLIGVPSGINKVVGLTMPASWSFDTIKRFSTLDTLEQEGALSKGKTRGQGLYKDIETENDKVIASVKEDVREYEEELETKLQDIEKRANSGDPVKFVGLPDKPEIGAARKIPGDLSSYITFLHPWMNEFLSLFVLLLMGFSLFIGTVFVLRIQDIF